MSDKYLGRMSSVVLSLHLLFAMGCGGGGSQLPSLVVDITPASATMGDTPVVASVSIPEALTSDLVVSLTSSDITEVTVPTSVTILQGTTSVSFNVTIVVEGVPDGPQTVTVTASASGYNDGTDTIIVNDPSILLCDPNTVESACVAGENPFDQAIDIVNLGDNEMNWTASDDAASPDWLTVTPASGTTVAGKSTLTVSIDTTGLVPGSYVANVTVTAIDSVTGLGAIGSPATVQVTLTVFANTPAMWHLDISIPGILGGVTGQENTGTHRAARFSDATATINYLELTYTDTCNWGRNYDAAGIIHTSSTMDHTTVYSGLIGAGQIGRNTPGYPDVMTFYARYDFDTSTYTMSTPGVSSYSIYDRKVLTFAADGMLWAKCWFNRGDGSAKPVMSSVRVLANITCVTMPGAVALHIDSEAGKNDIWWKPSPATEATAQKLFRSTSATGPWKQILEAGTNAVGFYTDANPVQGQTNYYMVVAVTAGGAFGAMSNVVSDADISLIAHWKMDETSGSVMSNASGTGNSGTITGATWTAGKFANGLNFDGVNDYARVVRNVSLEPANGITIALWGNITNSRPTVFSDLIRKSGAGQPGYVLRWSHGDGKLQFRLDRSLSPSIFVVDTVTNVAYLNSWHHYAATYDAAKGVAALYVDGGLRKVVTGLTGAIEHTDDLYMMFSSHPSQVALPGVIDDARIYSKALDEDEINALAKRIY